MALQAWLSGEHAFPIAFGPRSRFYRGSSRKYLGESKCFKTPPLPLALARACAAFIASSKTSIPSRAPSGNTYSLKMVWPWPWLRRVQEQSVDGLRCELNLKSRDLCTSKFMIFKSPPISFTTNLTFLTLVSGLISCLATGFRCRPAWWPSEDLSACVGMTKRVSLLPQRCNTN